MEKTRKGNFRYLVFDLPPRLPLDMPPLGWNYTPSGGISNRKPLSSSQKLKGITKPVPARDGSAPGSLESART
jgi:hypothetical protein